MPSEDAELQILASVQTILSGIALSKGCDVNRVTRIGSPMDLPRLALMYGEDDVVDDSLTYSDNEMELFVRALVHGESTGKTDDTVTQQLSALRRDVHAAISADRELGLPGLVIDAAPAGASAPDLQDRDADLPVVVRDFVWRVRYRTTASDRTQAGA